MIAVVVLTFRAPAGVLDRCIRAVQADGAADLVVVVDNGGDVDRDQLPLPVALLRSTDNLGYAGGMNAGIAYALSSGATSVAVLNDDAVVTDGWLTPLARCLHGRIGAAQPKLLLGTPDSQPRRIQSAGVMVRRDGAGIDVGYDQLDAGQFDTPREIELFSGAAVLLSREFLESVGGFDERYFLYYEDVDLARRGAAAGWTYRLEPSAVVFHEMSTTTSTVPGQRRYWQERNRLWCLFRHGSPRAIGRGLLLSAARLTKHPVKAQARAVIDGLRGAPAMLRDRRSGVTAVQPFDADRPVRWHAL